MLIVRKCLCYILILVLLLSVSPGCDAGEAPGVSAQSAVVFSCDDGELIYEKNPDQRMLIASTTKIMTAIVVIEEACLEDAVVIEPEYCQVEGSSMYLRAGQSYTVRELLIGLLLASGNDAALALSCYVAGDTAEFTRLMNIKAKSLDMSDTSFANPHGLNAENHYSTAHDMALLMAYCMENSVFAQLAGASNAEIHGQTFINHNRLLDTCPGCIGGKTGYTQRAGRCLVSCCERDGMRFVCVTLSAPDDWNDHKKLYNWAYSTFAYVMIGEGLSFDASVVTGGADSVRIIPRPVRALVNKSWEISFSAQLPRFVFAPVKRGEQAGSFTASVDGKEIARGGLYYAEDVPLFKKAK